MEEFRDEVKKVLREDPRVESFKVNISEYSGMAYVAFRIKSYPVKKITLSYNDYAASRVYGHHSSEQKIRMMLFGE